MISVALYKLLEIPLGVGVGALGCVLRIHTLKLFPGASGNQPS